MDFCQTIKLSDIGGDLPTLRAEVFIMPRGVKKDFCGFDRPKGGIVIKPIAATNSSAEGRPVKEKISRHKTSDLTHTPPPCTSLPHPKTPTNISGGVQRGIASVHAPPLAGFKRTESFCSGIGKGVLQRPSRGRGASSPTKKRSFIS